MDGNWEPTSTHRVFKIRTFRKCVIFIITVPLIFLKCCVLCTILCSFNLSVSGVLGVVFIILGVCLKYAILPVVVDSLVMSKLELVESNTETWDAFVTPPVTPFMKFTFFEVQVTESWKIMILIYLQGPSRWNRLW